MEAGVETETGDVLIVGGGPAGAATALALRKHAPEFSVTLVEATDYSQLRIGETLPPQAQAILYKLGVWQPFLQQAHCEALGTSTNWGLEQVAETPFILSPQQRGWHLDRRKFDQMLAIEARRAGASLCTGIKEAKFAGLQNTFVVDATGRRSSVARRRGAAPIQYDQLVGAMQFYQYDGQAQQQDGEQHRVHAPFNSYTHIEPWSQGWWYSALLPDRRAVVACMTDADICRRMHLGEQGPWSDLLAQTDTTAQRVSPARATGSIAVRAAYSQRMDRLIGDDWLAVGDAATTYDPLSGQGILKALRFGVFAAYAVGDHLRGSASALEKYDRWVSGDYEGYLDARHQHYREERRWCDQPFWQRRHHDTRPVEV